MIDSATMAQWVAAAAAICAAFLGIFGIWWQLRRQSLLHSASLITQLVAEFESQNWLEKRKACAARLRSHINGDALIDHRDQFAVLTFFEQIGYLARRGVIDEGMVWNKFGWHVQNYWIGLTEGQPKYNPVILDREKWPASWVETEYLVNIFRRMDKNVGVQALSVEDKKTLLDEFLRYEISLN